MKRVHPLLCLFFTMPTYLLASTFLESEFERSSREKLQNWTDKFSAIEMYFDRRLKMQETQVMYPEPREDLTAQILDGYDTHDYGNIALTEHLAFSTQMKYTCTHLGAFILKARGHYQAATDKYDSLVETHRHLRILFREVKQYKELDFRTTDLEESFVDGTSKKGHRLHLAAHEIWKRSVIVHLKCAVYMHNLMNEDPPNFLASSAYGFSAHRYVMIPALLEGKSHMMYGQLTFSLGGKNYNNTMGFIYDTGATHTSLPFSLLKSWGVHESDLNWNGIASTANGIGTVAYLDAKYLQLHTRVVFWGVELCINRRGMNCLLGTDISDQFLQEIRKGRDKTFMVIKNNP